MEAAEKKPKPNYMQATKAFIRKTSAISMGSDNLCINPEEEGRTNIRTPKALLEHQNAVPIWKQASKPAGGPSVTMGGGFGMHKAVMGVGQQTKKV